MIGSNFPTYKENNYKDVKTLIHLSLCTRIDVVLAIYLNAHFIAK